MKNVAFRAATTAALVALTASFAGAQQMVAASDTGYYRFNGTHTPTNTNYITGYCASCSVEGEHRSFFVFDLSGLDMIVTGASLSLPRYVDFTPDPSETFELHEVTTPAATLTAGSAGLAGFADLADGALYGTNTVILPAPDPVVTALTVAPVNAALGGTFVLGGQLSTLAAVSGTDEALFAGSNSGGGTLILDGAFCPDAPAPDCSTPGKSSFKIKAPGDASKASFSWKWLLGTADVTEFGAPLTGTPYALCVYMDGALLTTPALIEFGASWSAAPSAAPKKFKFKPAGPNNDGVFGAQLSSSLEGKAKISVKGKGANVDLPPTMPLMAATVTVQLHADSALDSCWQSSFATPFVKDEATLFLAKL